MRKGLMVTPNSYSYTRVMCLVRNRVLNSLCNLPFDKKGAKIRVVTFQVFC